MSHPVDDLLLQEFFGPQGASTPQPQGPQLVGPQPQDIDRLVAQQFFSDVSPTVPSEMQTNIQRMLEVPMSGRNANMRAIEDLQLILQRPDISDTQRQRINYLIDLYRKNKPANFANLAAIVGANIVGSTIDVADAFVGLGSMVPVVGRNLQGLRERAAASRAIIGEYSRAGKNLGEVPILGEVTTGNVAGIVGSLIGYAVPYGAAGGLTTRTLLRFLPGETAAKLATGLASGTIRYPARVALNVAGGVALDALRAATIPEATMEDKLKAFALDTGIGLIGAGLVEVQPIRKLWGLVGPELEGRAPKEGKPLTPPTEAEAKTREERVAEYQKRAEERQRAREDAKMARKRWDKASDEVRKRALGDQPDEIRRAKYKDLDEELQQRVLEFFKSEDLAGPAAKKAEDDAAKAKREQAQQAKEKGKAVVVRPKTLDDFRDQLQDNLGPIMDFMARGYVSDADAATDALSALSHLGITKNELSSFLYEAARRVNNEQAADIFTRLANALRGHTEAKAGPAEAHPKPSDSELRQKNRKKGMSELTLNELLELQMNIRNAVNDGISTVDEVADIVADLRAELERRGVEPKADTPTPDEAQATARGEGMAEADIRNAREDHIGSMEDDALVAWYKMNEEEASRNPDDLRARTEADAARAEITRRGIDLGGYDEFGTPIRPTEPPPEPTPSQAAPDQPPTSPDAQPPRPEGATPEGEGPPWLGPDTLSVLKQKARDAVSASNFVEIEAMVRVLEESKAAAAAQKAQWPAEAEQLLQDLKAVHKEVKAAQTENLSLIDRLPDVTPETNARAEEIDDLAKGMLAEQLRPFGGDHQAAADMLKQEILKSRDPRAAFFKTLDHLEEMKDLPEFEDMVNDLAAIQDLVDMAAKFSADRKLSFKSPEELKQEGLGYEAVAKFLDDLTADEDKMNAWMDAIVEDMQFGEKFVYGQMSTDPGAIQYLHRQLWEVFGENEFTPEQFTIWLLAERLRIPEIPRELVREVYKDLAPFLDALSKQGHAFKVVKDGGLVTYKLNEPPSLPSMHELQPGKGQTGTTSPAYTSSGSIGEQIPVLASKILQDPTADFGHTFGDMLEAIGWGKVYYHQLSTQGLDVYDVAYQIIKGAAAEGEHTLNRLRMWLEVYTYMHEGQSSLATEGTRVLRDMLDRLYPYKATFEIEDAVPEGRPEIKRGSDLYSQWAKVRKIKKRVLSELPDSELGLFAKWLAGRKSRLTVDDIDEGLAIQRMEKLVEYILEERRKAVKAPPTVEQPKAMAGGNLKLIPLKKPLHELSLKELDRLKGKVWDVFEEAGSPASMSDDLNHDLQILGGLVREWHARHGGRPPDRPPLEPLPVDPSTPPVVKVKPDEVPERMTREAREVYQGWVRKIRSESGRRSLEPHELEAGYNETIKRLADAHKAGDKTETKFYQEILDLFTKTMRSRGMNGDAGFTRPQVLSTIVGGIVGNFIGMETGDTEESRLANGIVGAIIGAGVGAGAGRLFEKPPKRPRTPNKPWMEEARRRVKSVEDETGNHSKSFLSWIERLYFQNVRRSYPLEKIFKLIGREDMPYRLSAAKMLEMFGIWKRQSDAAIFIKPFKVLENGDIIDADALSLTDISKMVNGRTDEFGIFLVAARSLELHANGRGTPPLDFATASQIFRDAPQEFFTAQVEALKYSRWLADIGVESGLISPELRQGFEEDAFYVPLIRLFDDVPPSPPVGAGRTGKKYGQSAKGGQPFQRLKTSDRPVRNGFEALIENTPKILRHAEFNRMALNMANSVVVLRKQGQKELADMIMQPLSTKGMKNQPPLSQAYTQVQLDEIEAEFKAHGVPSHVYKQAMEIFAQDPVDVTNGVLTFYRNGEIERWRIHPDVALAMRSLNADQFSILLRVLGMPAQVARVGITASPRFVFWQAFRDNFQLWLNSPEWFGYVPFVDQARGWWNIVTASPEYRKAVQGGLTGESLTAEGLRAVRTAVKRERSILEDVRVGKGQKLADKMVAGVKEMSVRKLYTDMIVPVADAARVGSYLRGRGRGLSVQEAVYRAKRVGVNYGQRGQHKLIHAFNHMTLFLNPSLQSIDEAARAFKRDPIMYTVKALVGITLPSIALWAAYKNDEEIQELRKTEAGKRYWWIRDMDGEIRKIPKPILDGQLWGSSVETFLDRQYAQDPYAWDTYIQAMSQDAVIHLLPTWGAIPVSIATNWNVNFGGPIVPESTERLDPQFQYNRATTDASRIVGSISAPVSKWLNDRDVMGFEQLARALSPAGMDFLVRNVVGELGFEGYTALGQAYRYLTEPGFDVTAEEAVVVHSLHPHYPTAGAASIREFYRHAKTAERTYNTIIAMLENNDPRAVDYINKHGEWIGAAQDILSVRSDLADLRAAINDVWDSPAMTRQEKRELIDEFLRTMTDRARATNEAIRLITQNTK